MNTVIRELLAAVGVLAWLICGYAFYVAFHTGGSDIQIIAAGIFGILGATAIGLSEVLRAIASREQE